MALCEFTAHVEHNVLPDEDTRAELALLGPLRELDGVRLEGLARRPKTWGRLAQFF